MSFDGVSLGPIVADGLAAHLSRLGLRQLHLAETEKYAHVTYFFNGGIEAPFALLLVHGCSP